MMSFDLKKTGKPEWREMLQYTINLHRKSTHPAISPFVHSWEEIGPGYCYAPAFGHWDIVHAAIDMLPVDPEHARRQLENNLIAQQADGLVPGSLWLAGETVTWDRHAGHPPVWPYAIQDYMDTHGQDVMPWALNALVKQIEWFEKNRQADNIGFFYTDILNNVWESGVDEGIRFIDVQTGPLACVDATAHLFAVYSFASRWSQALGRDALEFEQKAKALQLFMQDELFVEETGFFHDIWSAQDPDLRCLAFEGMWPMVVGAATKDQARQVIHDNLLNPRRFFTKHPISSVAVSDPHFELRMWRGPAWNSMTYWAARGCVLYGEYAAAQQLLERALDCSAQEFARSGTIWEFYHPDGGNPEDVMRKPDKKAKIPCADYLGHDPFIAMSLLYDTCVLHAEAL